MNIFVTGATGVLGKVVTRLLIESGHTVRAAARSTDNETHLRSAGAWPVRTSFFETASLQGALKNCQALLHLATHIPPTNQASQRKAWQENDRIRAEGTRNLVDAALEAGVSTLIYPGVTFVYPDAGANWLDTNSPTAPPSIVKSSLAAEAEVARFTKAGNRGIVLRMGIFYGPIASNGMLHMARSGISIFAGRAKGYQSLIWVDDAALAVIDALARAPAGIYNVVDDEPLQRWELTAALALALRRRWLFRPPSFLFRLIAGRHLMFLTRSHRVSNSEFKAATGWTPMIPSARVGFPLLSIPP